MWLDACLDRWLMFLISVVSFEGFASQPWHPAPSETIRHITLGTLVERDLQEHAAVKGSERSVVRIALLCGAREKVIVKREQECVVIHGYHNISWVA